MMGTTTFRANNFVSVLLLCLFMSCAQEKNPVDPGYDTGSPKDDVPVTDAPVDIDLPNAYDDSDKSDWLIPADQVIDGGPGKDGIPALSTPETALVGATNYLGDDDLVLGVKIGNRVRAYPHQILDWHEIANDQIGEESFSVTYCPLTGSGMNWNRTLENSATTFGVSGLLYNNNLLPYDRATDSYWSQMLMMSVFGDRAGMEAELMPLIETTWSTWKSMYPESEVITVNTGYSRPYGDYPYGNYKESEHTLFPISVSDQRLHMKERVAGIVRNERSKVYRFSEFADSIRTINDNFQALPIVIAGSEQLQILVIYSRQLEDGTILTMNPVQSQLPAVMTDDEGNLWDIFGVAISGPRAGSALPQTKSFIAFWFAFGTFYPAPEIFNTSTLGID